MPCTSEGIVWTGSSVVRVANADGCVVGRTHVHACPLNTAFWRLHSWHAVVDREWLEVRRQAGYYNSQVDWPRSSWLRTSLSPVVGFLWYVTFMVCQYILWYVYCVCVCVNTYIHTYVRTYVRACVRACVRVCVCVYQIWLKSDNSQLRYTI